MVTERFCDELIAEMENFGQWSDGSNSVSNKRSLSSFFFKFKITSTPNRQQLVYTIPNQSIIMLLYQHSLKPYWLALRPKKRVQWNTSWLIVNMPQYVFNLHLSVLTWHHLAVRMFDGGIMSKGSAAGRWLRKCADSRHSHAPNRHGTSMACIFARLCTAVTGTSFLGISPLRKLKRKREKERENAIISLKCMEWQRNHHQLLRKEEKEDDLRNQLFNHRRSNRYVLN